MKTKRTFAVFVIIIGFLFISNAQPMQVKGSAETEALAEKIVNQCASIQEGEFVLVTGGIRDIELLENIVINLGKRGAFPILTIGLPRCLKNMIRVFPKVI